MSVIERLGLAEYRMEAQGVILTRRIGGKVLVAFTGIPKTPPRGLLQSIESTRGKTLDGGVPETSVFGTP
jgi:hypothetical protein